MFKGVIVQIECVVEIQSESACATLAMPHFMHLRQVVLKKKISIFPCVFPFKTQERKDPNKFQAAEPREDF